MIIADTIVTITVSIGASSSVGIATGTMIGTTVVQQDGTKAARKAGRIETFHRVQRKDITAVATGTAIMTANGRAIITAPIRTATVTIE